MKNKIHSYIGFARKSRSLAAGYNACEAAFEKKKVKLILLSNSLAENSQKKFQKKAREQSVPIRLISDSKELSAAAGRTGIEIFGILDPNLAAAILKQIDNDGQNA